MTKKGIVGTRKEVRKFGLLFAGLCAAGTAYALYRGAASWPWFSAGGAFFLVTGLFGYPVLRPIYIGWMKFAFILGWINTRILLGVFFYLILTPIGFLMRLFGKDILDQKIDRNVGSYWIKRERTAFNPRRYEQLF